LTIKNKMEHPYFYTHVRARVETYTQRLLHHLLIIDFSNYSRQKF